MTNGKTQSGNSGFFFWASCLAAIRLTSCKCRTLLHLPQRKV